MSLATFQSKLAQASTAIADGDYDSARTHALSAQALLAAIPNQESGDEKFDFDRRAGEIAALLGQIDKAQAAAAGIRRITPP